jgi:hypothetical protein
MAWKKLFLKHSGLFGLLPLTLQDRLRLLTTSFVVLPCIFVPGAKKCVLQGVMFYQLVKANVFEVLKTKGVWKRRLAGCDCRFLTKGVKFVFQEKKDGVACPNQSPKFGLKFFSWWNRGSRHGGGGGGEVLGLKGASGSRVVARA